MSNIAALSLLFLQAACAEQLFGAQAEGRLHPIRQSLVDEIKAKTTKWRPTEVAENHFRNVPVDTLYNSFGAMDMSQQKQDLLD